MHTDYEELRCDHYDRRSSSQSVALEMRGAFAVGRSTLRNGIGTIHFCRIRAVVRTMTEMKFQDDGETAAEKMRNYELDEAIVHVGEFGKFQKRIYYLICIPAMYCAMTNLIMVFTAGIPRHR
ncbi:unnamed protein product [Darwinula stevensoni]|uniref:Uncharacterized protein n=1 Tax=Darwinula stevensoni TaxID=69355 RepID=A0A7R8X4J7_9CRUS|nr:unnamed protein product [Darwinula stevensoni]CAG0885238.1 unnamed protein product [Darwinula stevensoni]